MTRNTQGFGDELAPGRIWINRGKCDTREHRGDDRCNSIARWALAVLPLRSMEPDVVYGSLYNPEVSSNYAAHSDGDS